MLHDKLQKELLVVPGFPSADVSYKVGLGDYAARGKALCRYACRVHASLGARGMFSPRLLAFLEIDAARVHIEEDGRATSYTLKLTPKLLEVRSIGGQIYACTVAQHEVG